MTQHRIVSRDAWVEARKQLLAKEKAFTLERDKLSRERRSLPWVKVEKDYVFEGPDGQMSMVDAFAGHSQLVVYHFMYGPDWEEPCKSCSFWADNFNGIVEHLKHRDVSFVAISRAPLPTLQAFAKRMGWSFNWLSSEASDFNYDFDASYRPEDLEAGNTTYNYAPNTYSMSELAGTSVFYKDDEGSIFHTYSCYARGLDMMNTAYNYLDLVPKGRDEAELEHTMSWVKFRDEYES